MGNHCATMLPSIHREAVFDRCAWEKGRIYLSIDDLIFPSLLINFCRIFDLGNGHRFPIYYSQVLFSYIVALVLAYTTMTLTKFDQLFSMFIYPTIFVSTLITALVRGECRNLFYGTLKLWKPAQPATPSENSF